MSGVIHFNPHLSHQRDHADAFLACGFTASPNIHDEADIHVISGNWYAFQQWKHHPRVLMIDRAWWGDPDCISIGWLNPDGTRRFASGKAPRPHPQPAPWKTEEKTCLVLLGYGEKEPSFLDQLIHRFSSVEIRKHPAEAPNQSGSLRDAISCRDVVVCGAGTAGFDSIIQGVPTICYDERSELMPVCTSSIHGELYRGDRYAWLHGMSYKQFTLSEIKSGLAWELLKEAE